ncbi:hypothetical protein BCR33DRAFT_483871 [Rhizoclosmatium globosum]|uniref:Dynamin N-terminal domain-containing protein n=1 Tax=Rhizoclosmatium globosum TaxID=329046 RepID=A0A1Y2BPL6_9FUNG|nr:hypothetical protein BCR33DRAFT_483871 [Rhizoclosmatium globosum]|eukprot:ORY36105.1 hypothetical protein BCR33DRAFT_483871 [Rhizoclosmatium globosum]
MLVGTVNAGKSSLLNAVLGNQISPTASKPMTATMMTFVHSPTNQNQKSPRITIQSLSDGERDILLDVDANPAGISEAREFLDEINKNLRDSIFEGDVDEAANSELCTNMPFPYMPQTEVDVVLRDCPGTNEDCSDRIRNRWRSYMHAADVLIVVLDYTQQGSQAEAELFETIVAERGHLHGVLVVVNKADHIGPDLVEYEELRAKTCARVQTYSGKEVSKDCVFFVSATKALIARSIICNSSFKEDNAVFQENFKWLTPLAINTFSNKFKPKPIVKSFSDLEMTLFDWTGLSAEGILEHTHWHDFEHALIRSVVYADAMRVKTGCASILASLHLVSVECKTQITRYRDGVAKNRVEELQRMHQQFLDFVNGEVSDEVEQHYVSFLFLNQ